MDENQGFFKSLLFGHLIILSSYPNDKGLLDLSNCKYCVVKKKTIFLKKKKASDRFSVYSKAKLESLFIKFWVETSLNSLSWEDTVVEACLCSTGLLF